MDASGKANDLRIREAEFSGDAYAQEVDLRYRILRKPLGLMFTPAQLEEDKGDIHIHAYIEDRLAGCLLLRPFGNEVLRMRQVAVDNDLQGLGIGSAMVEFAENLSRLRGIKHIEVHARISAIAFYERAGYTVVSEEYEEVTIPHRTLNKAL